MAGDTTSGKGRQCIAMAIAILLGIAAMGCNDKFPAGPDSAEQDDTTVFGGNTLNITDLLAVTHQYKVLSTNDANPTGFFYMNGERQIQIGGDFLRDGVPMSYRLSLRIPGSDTTFAWEATTLDAQLLIYDSNGGSTNVSLYTALSGVTHSMDVYSSFGRAMRGEFSGRVLGLNPEFSLLEIRGTFDIGF